MYICVVAVILCVLYAGYYCLIKYNLTITNDGVTTYQYLQLRISYLSSFVTSLALIVALLKDEIRTLWRYSKITIKPKEKDFLMECCSNFEKDIRAEYYYAMLTVINEGSLHISSCTISLTGLKHISSTGHENEIDVKQ